MPALEQMIKAQLDFTPIVFFTTNALSSSYAGASFQLNAFANYGEYVALFDQYRIEQIEAWLEPFQVSQASAFGDLSTCVDLDDSSNPPNLAAVQAHQGSLTGSGAAGHYHKWRPHVATAAYNGSFGGFNNVASPWVDSASPNVQHYGFKAAAGPTTGGTFAYVLYARAIVSFRAPGI